MHQEAEQKVQPSLDDIGTRYQHLRDYLDALEFCATTLEQRGLNNPDNAFRHAKFKVAIELLNVTLDSFSGIKEHKNEAYLYRLLNDIPKADTIDGGRGTPLR